MRASRTLDSIIRTCSAYNTPRRHFMRAFGFALASSLLLAQPSRRRAACGSLNLCTDELLLLLADPRQIASVTHLSQRPEETPLWQEARRYRV
jgi:iron complex transport system substrate-binding protein